MKQIYFFTLFLILISSCIGIDKKESINSESADTIKISNNSENVDTIQVSSVLAGDSLPANYKNNPVSAPVRNIKIIDNPADSLAPKIIADRLSIFFEDLDTDMNAFVKEFKKLYPKDEYKVISYNDELKTLELSVPTDVRDLMVNGLNSQMSNFKFIITVESIYKQQSVSIKNKCSNPNAGWHINAIKLHDAWKKTKGSSDVKVAILDDGFDLNHEMFSGRIYNPYNIATYDNNVSRELSSLGVRIKKDSVSFIDDYSVHGTHVAALAVGSDIYEEEGVTGVAPGCLFMPIKVYQNGICTDKFIFEAICYAANHGADVINVSVGLNINGLDFDKMPIEFQREYAQKALKSNERLYDIAYTRANQKNAIVVVAAGNDHVISSVAPKNRTGKAIVVCASNKENKATSFTNYGDGSTITAPGEEIFSAMPNNKYGCLDGTSMAAPIVSGLVALMKSHNKNITFREVVNKLVSNGIKIGDDVPNLVQASGLFGLEGALPGVFSVSPKKRSESLKKISSKNRGLVDSLESGTIGYNGKCPVLKKNDDFMPPPLNRYNLSDAMLDNAHVRRYNDNFRLDQEYEKINRHYDSIVRSK